jgi:hypothetical protein
MGKSLESTAAQAAPLDDARVKQSIDFLKQALGRASARHAGNADLKAKVTDSAEAGLKKLATDGPGVELSVGERLGIEAVIHADGSRPVFFIREGAVDRTGVEAGKWGDALDSRVNAIWKHAGKARTVRCHRREA